ncbi:MAG: hypothetical protein LBC46_03305 [Treponema sp.]|nr:hypothetical protein [Treponema sp.]
MSLTPAIANISGTDAWLASLAPAIASVSDTGALLMPLAPAPANVSDTGPSRPFLPPPALFCTTDEPKKEELCCLNGKT